MLVRDRYDDGGFSGGKRERSALQRLLRLTLLAPDIVSAILHGRQPEGVTLPALMGPFSLRWETQCGRQRGSC